MPERIAFLDIDTQRDFMLAEGALYVPGAEQIIPRLGELVKLARDCGIPVISTADAHPPDDPSFRQWPPHCVTGTPGQLRIRETTQAGARIIPNRPFKLEPQLYLTGQTIFEKTDYDATSNPNFGAVVRQLGISRLVTFGVATDYCVCATVLSVRRLGIPVDLVLDALKGITEESSQRAIQQMIAAGVRVINTADVLVEFGSAQKR
ncbi:MAG TPA: isochorismatase family protein [Terriglobia bacterium]|nr:isochorismatase family protein [Terriglobia bacterium]